MKKVESKMDLPSLEKEILKFWQTEKIFEESLKQREGGPSFSFYDGPPFATGTPHYGHIVASIMKDAVPRYAAMKGYYVPRVWGWDCHGLPIENIAEKELGLKNKKDIEDIGIAKFNEFCRSKVLEYASEWKVVIERLGRWVEMDNSYKTMDLSYMESVWWVFKQLWDQGLIYESYRSMHICPRCETTLSQSEVTEGYKTVKDLSAIVEFKLSDEPDTSILAWTTTPWTLIGNVALAVGRDIDYVKLEKPDGGDGSMVKFIIAKDRLKDVFGNDEIKVISEFKGAEIEGARYKPLFEFDKERELENRDNGWRVVAADFVTTDEGTGIVHIAPAFGEDDMRLGREKNLPFIQHVGMDGLIRPGYGQFSGMNVKPIDDVQRTDVEVIKYLATQNLLFEKAKYEHSYPHCWRCDTPLLNYATSSLFVDVEKIKDEALIQAKEINWSPSHLKKGRFGKWLEGAKDWSISRQRFWATTIPIWKCECGEQEVFGSVSELESRSGEKIEDIHKHKIDDIELECQKCSGKMRRVSDVLDTWFDSGSMPYAQVHYPFENKAQFESSFPAEFIGEGVDQTRAWFYYLHVISTAIFHKPAFKNVTVNGIVLAEDGKKMAKRLKNYPDPMEMLEKYGADVMRYYLLTSPVMAAENLNFSENEMAQISRGVFRMLWNSYSFFTLYAELDNWQGQSTDYNLSENILDRWIVSKLEGMNLEIDHQMKKYDLVKSSRVFIEYMDNLSNWYIRRNRKRFWKSENDTDKQSAFATLNYVLTKISLLLAPFCPFISEEIYRNLAGGKSVHLCDYPQARKDWVDNGLEEEMERAREIIESLLALREKSSIKVRQPLAAAQYLGEKLSVELESIITDEVNLKSIKCTDLLSFRAKDETVSLDTEITDDLKCEGLARELIREIQVARKRLGFEVSDRISLGYDTSSPALEEALRQYGKEISAEVLAVQIEKNQTGKLHQVSIGNEEIRLYLAKAVDV